jgi:2-succinyl-6-hydroxy-2,4-cyclohexadiene-1-carboxylate synthase
VGREQHPVRDWTLAARQWPPIRPLSNRGANGIDGVVSTALGSAAAEVGPVVLVVGDVSFLHDLNALVAARLHDLSATIVLIDNDGGGIFSFLPQATTDAPEVGLPDHYEELFGTPHGIDVGPIATALGGEYRGRSASCAKRWASVGSRVCRSSLSDGARAERRVASRGRGSRGRCCHPRERHRVDGLTGSPARGRVPLLLHGFTGRGTSWGAHATAFARRFRVVVVDLPGHGRSGARQPARAGVGVPRMTSPILRREGCAPAYVLGYSLGARVALRLAVTRPDVVRRLVLESPSAGIATDAERSARRATDGARADRVERDGIEAFVDEWQREPVFASHANLPPARAARLRAERLRNRPAGLAISLRGAGQGSMEPLHDRLGEVRAPTLVIAGALDGTGRARAEAVAAGIPGARLETVPGAGHTPHLETPAIFRSLALEHLMEDSAA